MKALILALSCFMVMGQAHGVTIDATFATNSSSGSPGGLALDSDNNLYVSNYGNSTLDKFPVSGGLVTGGTADSPAYSGFVVNANPGAMVIDSGNNLYVAGTSKVYKFVATGGAVDVSSPIDFITTGLTGTPNTLLVDRSDNLYVLDNASTVKKYNSAGVLQDGSFITGLNNANGLAIDSANNLYVAESGGNRIKKYAAVGGAVSNAGTVTANFITGITSPTALAIDGDNNLYVADDVGKLYKFAASGGAVTGGAAGAAIADASLGYVAGLIADNSNNLYVTDQFGTGVTKIALGGPTATTSAASGIGTTGATLNGTVNDNGSSTTVTFDYGTTTTYGTNVAATTGGTVGAGSGSTATAVTIAGLTCNTTYHFRVKAVNANGTSFGYDKTFTASACPVTYTVTYNGNGNTGGSAPTDGSSPYNSGSTVTVLGNTGSLAKTGYTFAGWNTASDGSGTSRAPASTFSIAANTTLYAQWTPITYTVTYNGNGNTGGSAPTDGSSPYNSGSTVTVLGNTGSLTKTGYTFASWNTASDGSGSSYAPAATFSIAANTTLHAQWTANAPSATSGSASSITATGVTLNGTVNDNGLTTTVTFDHGLTTGYGTNVAATTGGTVNAGSGNTATAVTIAGLTCNTAYHFRVKATSAGGTTNGSDASFTSGACVPGAPTIGTATAGDTQATVTFTAPGSNGGAAITGYTATSSPGGLTGTCASSPCTVTGLTNGTAYTFTVTATNSAGTGSASTASNSVTPKASQTITFANPGAQNFGTAPTLTASAAPSGLTVSFTSATTGVCTITGGGALTFVTAGTCTINADQAGNSTYNAAPQVQQSFTVNAVVPGAPTIGTATAGNTQATVSFSAPASNGGASITSYTATSSPGGITGTCASSPCTVTGLTNGVAYTFTVTATNSAGTGSASTASNGITPAANQTITFAAPGAQNFGTTPTLTATSDSGLTVTFTSAATGVCTVTSGGTLTFVTAGTCTINADQAGNSSYLPASQVQRSFTVNAVVPDAPTIGTATAGNTQATVSFSAPASNGGANITGYTATSSPSGITGTCVSSPCTVTGLTNGVAYTFTVTATNSAGTGSASTASNSVTPNPGPAVNSVAVPPDGRYKAGSNLDFTVTWDSPVIITGTPRIALTIGSTTRYADYLSGSGTTATVFRHTVQTGDTDTDGIAVGALTLNGGTIQSASNVDATLTLNSVGSTTNVLVDTTAPILPAANIVVNNQADPHKAILTFNEALDGTSLGSAGGWTVTDNAGTTTYSIASVALSSTNIVTLTLNAVDLSGSTTTIGNATAAGHLKVTPPATLKDVAGNTYAAGMVTESGASHVLDTTAPTLSTVSGNATSSSGGTLTATASEKVKGYWIAVASGAPAPTVAQVKAAINYGAVAVAASGNGALPGGTAGNLTLTGLSASTAYDLYLVAEDAAGNLGATAETATLTTKTAPSGGGDSSPTVILPSGGGSATPTPGQTIVVTDNGHSGTTINLPPPATPGGTGSPSSNVTVTLPGTGSVSVGSNSGSTQLLIQQVSLPGSSVPVSTFSVNSGSATITAASAGQTLVTTGISNGLTVTAGSSGSSATITVNGDSQSIALSGSIRLTQGTDALDTKRTSVTLLPTAGGGDSQATLDIGGHDLVIRTDGGYSQVLITPTVVDGQTVNAVVVVGGSVSLSGDTGQLLNVIPAASACGQGSGGNAYFEARSNNAQSDVLSVNQGGLALTGYIPSGVVVYHYTSNGCNASLRSMPLDGGLDREVLIYEGEYVEVDQRGQPTKIVVRSKNGRSGAAGDPIDSPTTDGRTKYEPIDGLSLGNATIPRIDLAASRLGNGQTIQASLESLFKLADNGWSAIGQDAQGTIRIVHPDGSRIAAVPLGEVLADAERPDGIQFYGNGLYQLTVGHLSTRFNAALDAPAAFIAALRRIDPSASMRLTGDGNLQVSLNAHSYLAQVGWDVLPGKTAATSGDFSTYGDGLWFTSSQGRQALYPVLADLERLRTVMKKFDANAIAQGDHRGGIDIAFLGENYRLVPEWELIATPPAHAQDDFWIDGEIIYLNYLGGTAQGVQVK